MCNGRGSAEHRRVLAGGVLMRASWQQRRKHGVSEATDGVLSLAPSWLMKSSKSIDASPGHHSCHGCGLGGNDSIVVQRMQELARGLQRHNAGTRWEGRNAATTVAPGHLLHKGARAARDDLASEAMPQVDTRGLANLRNDMNMARASSRQHRHAKFAEDTLTC